MTTQTVEPSINRSTIDLSLKRIADVIKTTNVRNDGLLNGGLGTAMYLLYLSSYTNNFEYQALGKERLENILNRAINGTSNLLRKNSLLNGAVGLAWTLQVLVEEGLIHESCCEFLPRIDRIIFDRIPDQIQKDSLDHIHSSIGAIAYLVAREKENSEIIDYLKLLVKKLKNKVRVYDRKGAFIRNQHYYNKSGIGHEHDVNLRLPHGYCGILLTLIKVYKIGIAQKTVRDILEQGIPFILSTMNPENFDDPKKYIFPSNIITSLPKDHPTNLKFYEVRTGWCYGDLSQIFLLYLAGHLFNRRDWITIADQVGSFTLEKRSNEETMIGDSCLCHGTSGVGQFYRALYRASINDKYLDGYEYWMQKTTQWVEEILAGNAWPIKFYSFLEGLVGSGLALMDYSSGKHSKWEKFLLLQ